MKFTGSILFVTAAYLATLVSADPIISIASPLTGTVYTAGSEAIIAWNNPTVKTISQIVLAKGKSNALQPILTIATNVNAADMKYVWKIPFEIDTAEDYAFEFGTSPDLAFAGPFSIKGGVGANPAGVSSNTTASSTPAANPASQPNSPPAGAAPVSPATTSSGANTQTSPHNANSSHASAANKQSAGQAVALVGMVAGIASQFF